MIPVASPLLWYRQFRKDLGDIDFELNPYDPCVVDCCNGHTPTTVLFYVDDFFVSSPMNAKVNDDFQVWLKEKYSRHSAGTATTGKFHDYVGKSALLVLEPWFVPEPSHDSFDLVNAIWQLIQESPLSWTVEWVEAHQDEDGKLVSL
jgi:hypothetical protein